MKKRFDEVNSKFKPVNEKMRDVDVSLNTCSICPTLHEKVMEQRRNINDGRKMVNSSVGRLDWKFERLGKYGFLAIERENNQF